MEWIPVLPSSIEPRHFAGLPESIIELNPVVTTAGYPETEEIKKVLLSLFFLPSISLILFSMTEQMIIGNMNEQVAFI